MLTRHKGYDVFLSHSRADKAWVRQLYDRLAATDHHGRPLRAWLDREILPLLVQILCQPPDGGYDEYSHRRAVHRAWGNARAAIGEDFDPTPTEAAEALLALLLSYDIDALDEEGPALVGFERAGDLTAELDANEAYGMNMVLGEILALAILRSPVYRGAAQGYVAADRRAEKRASFLTVRNRLLANRTGPPTTTNRLFAVARAASKIVEVDPRGIDLSLLASVCHRLDERGGRTIDERVVSIMVGRTLGKVRGTQLAETLLHTLVAAGGNSSHLATAVAISTAYGDDDPPVYYTQEMADLGAGRPQPQPGPPSGSIVRLLEYTSRLAAPDHDLRADLDRCLEGFTVNFGPVSDLVGPSPGLRYAPAPTALVNGPLVGTVRRITLANMERSANSLGPTDIACLTENRIVDALLEGASGYLIDDAQVDAPLGTRLRGRGARFAAFDRSTLDRFSEGDFLVLWPGADGRADGRWGPGKRPG